MSKTSRIKPVSFKNNDKDDKIFNHVKDKDFSYYVKELIYKDMIKNKTIENSEY